MITDYYGDGNRYRGVTSRGGKTRTIVIAGNAVLHDTANDREDADHKRKEPKTMYTMTVKALEGALRNMEMYHAKDCACNECKNIREALAAERATPMRKAPELYAALQELEGWARARENTMGDPCRLLECQDGVRRAIAKARTLLEEIAG